MKLVPSLIILAVLALIVSACGGSKPAATSAPAATNTTIPVYSYQAPTEPPIFASLAATEVEATAQPAATEAAGTAQAVAAANLDPELVARGESRYVALACGSCHGDKGEGTDKAKAIAGAPMGEDAFVKFLQTGGNLGNAHLFAGNKLSPTGAHNLYLYVLSLAPAS